MKVKSFCFVVWLILMASAAFAQTTAFTYQGRLNDAGNPAKAWGRPAGECMKRPGRQTSISKCPCQARSLDAAYHLGPGPSPNARKDVQALPVRYFISLNADGEVMAATAGVGVGDGDVPLN